MTTQQPPARWQVVGILGAGIVAVSTAAPLVRLAMQAASDRSLGFSLVLAAARLSFAAVLLLPHGTHILRRQPPTRTAWGWAIAAGITLALHFAAWITSLGFTSIAASTTLVTTNPIWIALLSWIWFGERPTGQRWLGIAIALLGSGVIAFGGSPSSAVESAPLLGNGLALLGAWTVSVYLLLGREAQRQGLGLGAYITIAYTVAAIALLPLPWLVGTHYRDYDLPVYGYIFLTTLLPQLIGHTSLNWAVRWISPTVVALVVLIEPVLASGLGWLLFAEVPSVAVLAGAIVVLLGVAIAVMGAPHHPQSSEG